MKRKRFTESQIFTILKEFDAGKNMAFTYNSYSQANQHRAHTSNVLMVASEGMFWTPICLTTSIKLKRSQTNGWKITITTDLMMPYTGTAQWIYGKLLRSFPQTHRIL